MTAYKIGMETPIENGYVNKDAMKKVAEVLKKHDLPKKGETAVIVDKNGVETYWAYLADFLVVEYHHNGVGTIQRVDAED